MDNRSFETVSDEVKQWQEYFKIYAPAITSIEVDYDIRRLEHIYGFVFSWVEDVRPCRHTVTLRNSDIEEFVEEGIGMSRLQALVRYFREIPRIAALVEPWVRVTPSVHKKVEVRKYIPKRRIMVRRNVLLVGD